MSSDTIPGRQLLRLSAVVVKTGLSRSTIYRLAAAGQFPRPIWLTAHTSTWDAAEIDRWIAEREAVTHRMRAGGAA